MNAVAMNPMVPVLPDSAPFSTEQRSWLNGFFAGLLGLGAGSAGAHGANGEQAMVVAKPQAAEEEETFPWHDAAMAMDERMKLAEGKPVERKLMAAMAQLDCGACGYLCKTYAEAIANGEQRDLTLCQPGGKATAVKLKELVKLGVNGKRVEGATSSAGSAKPRAAGEAEAQAKGFGKENPFPAPLIAC
jgi:sulfite reductase (NADPH) flavoprotein alpha-component